MEGDEALVHAVDHPWRQGRGRLVDEQEPGAGDQGPGQREDPLLAAGEAPGHLPAPVAQERKALEHPLDGRAHRATGGEDVPPENKVVVHGHLGEKPPVLGDVAEASPHGLIGP